MDERRRIMVVSSVSAAVAGALGAVSGSNSWVVVAIYSAVMGLMISWIIRSFMK